MKKLFFFLFIFVLVGWMAYAQTTAEATDLALTSQQDVNQLKEEAKKKEQKLEEVAAEAEKALLEAEKIAAEKETLEKEAELKTEAAQVTKEELEILKKETKFGKKDPELREKIKGLETEYAALQKEAQTLKQQLALKEKKEKLAVKKASLAESKAKNLAQNVELLDQMRRAQKGFLAKTVTAIIIILVGLLLYLVIGKAYRKFQQLITKEGVIRESDSTLRFKTLLQLAYWVGTIVLFLAILYMVLNEFGVNVAPLLAGMGIVGLAFGFGGQYLIRDIISGIFVLFEDQFHVNDVVKIGDLAGLVQKINLRVTVLRDLEGRVIFIPNGEIKSVINYTKEWSRALFDIGVAYKENVDHVMDVIKQLGKEMREDPYYSKLILNDLEMLGVDSFGDSEVTIKFMIQTLPIKQWEVSREFRRRLKNRFDELGIEIPFPHRTLYWGVGPENDFMKKYFEANQSKKI